MSEPRAPGPEIDVVILTWNDGELLDAAVRSALASDHVRPNVVVVDNGSEPPAATDGRALLVRNPRNVGVARGRNQGARLGQSDLICFLDSDAVLGSDSLSRMARLFSDPRVAVTVPVFEGQVPEASAGRAPTLRLKIERGLGRRATYEPTDQADSARMWDVEFGIGACQLIRREAFEAVGGLDESIFFGPEDLDFCLRVLAAGWRVVQMADSGVSHPPRRAFRKPLTVKGARHAWSVARHHWRHRQTHR